MKLTKFGDYSQRLDYTKQNLGSGVFPDSLNHIMISNFYRFRDEVLETTFKKYFPIQSKDKSRILSLKKVIVNQPKRSFEGVHSSLGSYDFSINLSFTYSIRETKIKLASINIYKTHLDALRK